MIHNTYKKKIIYKWLVFTLLFLLDFYGFSQDPYSFSNNIRFEITLEPGNFLYVDDDNITGPWTGTQTFPFENIPEALAASSTDVTVVVNPGNYLINQNITVPIDVNLFLFHGDTLVFGPNYSLQVNGRIQAFGSKSDSIYFTSSSPATTWDGIRFINSQLTSELRYCKIDRSIGTDGNEGGGIYTSNSMLKLFGCLVENNTANYGAGIFCENNSSVEMEACIIANNSANIDGGGFYGVLMDSLTISSSIFENNSATSDGGGMALADSRVQLIENEFLNNDATNGAGIHFDNVSADSTNISWNTIISNIASTDGGGMYVNNSNTLDFSRNKFIENSADDGGGLYLNNSQSNVYNNTIYLNSASNFGGGLSSNLGTNEIFNNILWANTSSNDSQLAGTGVNASYNDVEGGFGGTGNFSANPLFVDPTLGNFNLQIKSPCINRGNPANLPDPDSTIADLGMHFYYHHPAEIIDQPTDVKVNVDNNVSITLNATWALDYQWEVSTNNGVDWANVIDPLVYSDFTTPTLQLSNVPLSMDGNKYRCKVYGAGTIPLYSNEVDLYVYPVITTSVAPLTTCPGIINIPVKLNAVQSVDLGSISQTFNFNDLSLNHIGYQNLHPQISPAGFIMNAVAGELFVSWVSLTPATINDEDILFEITFDGSPGTSDLTFDVVTTGACEYSDEGGFVFISQFNDGLVTTHQNPVITSQPVNEDVYTGDNASFSIAGSATGATYQWEVSKDDGNSWLNLENSFIYAGVTTNQLNITNAILVLDGYQFRCILSGTCSPAAISNSVVLTVTDPPPSILTFAPTTSTCVGEILVPINVINCDSIGAISLVISYNEAVLTYTGYQNAHGELASGFLIVNPSNGNVIVSWASTTPANIGEDILIELVFTAASGSSDLVWDISNQGNCEYSDYDGNVLLSTFYDGSVTISNCATQMDLKVILEGPFNGVDMDTELNAYLPAAQPFGDSPWNYSGTENAIPMPSGSIVDWGLIELRETAGDASTAIESTIVAQQAVLIRKDGTVKSLDGSNLPNFTETITNNLFVVIHQRNHLSVMSANPVTVSGSAFTYDFSSSVGQVYGGALGHKEIGTGIWGMTAGDGNADGIININDKIDPWVIQSGEKGYIMGDFNLDGQVNNSDKNLKWLPNTGSGTQVPN